MLVRVNGANKGTLIKGHHTKLLIKGHHTKLKNRARWSGTSLACRSVCLHHFKSTEGIMYKKISEDIKEDYYQQNFPNDGQRFVDWYLRNIHLRFLVIFISLSKV